MAKQTKRTSYQAIVGGVFNNLVSVYQKLFSIAPPFVPSIPTSKKKLIYPERNLTFNFCNEYLRSAGKTNGDEIIVWQELHIQAGNNSGLVDSVIIDMRANVKAILFIEAKRIAGTVGGIHKCEKLREDMSRLDDINMPQNSGSYKISNELSNLIRNHQLTAYKMALVDYWEWNGNRGNRDTRCKNQIENCTGTQFVQINSQPIHKGLYFIHYCLAPIPHPQTAQCFCTNRGNTISPH